MNKLLSIITINYNNKIGLEKTISSVISQTFTNFEYIIIDGGSNDQSVDVLSKYSNSIDCIVSEKDKGIYDAMNKGIKKATGKYLLFLNSGDELNSKNVLTDIFSIGINEKDLLIGKLKIDGKICDFPKKLTKKFFLKEGISHPSTFIKKDLFDKYGLYDEGNKITSDWIFFFNTIFKYKISYTNIPFIVSNFDTNGVSSNPENAKLIEFEKKRFLKNKFLLLYFFYYFIYLNSLNLLSIIKRGIYNRLFYPIVIISENCISYLRFSINKNRSPNSFYDIKIGFAILSHNRPEYLVKCLESLYKSDFDNLHITILISDDGSDDQKVFEIINKDAPASLNVIRILNKKGPNNAGAAINIAMKKLNEIDQFDIIGWADSDCLFQKDWLKKGLSSYLWAYEHHKFNKIGPFTTFNSSDTSFHKILGEYKSPHGNYLIKRQAGMLNYLMFKSDWLKYGPFDENGDDETNMTIKLERDGIRNFCTKTSYVEHMGQNSVLNTWRPTKIKRSVFGLDLVKNSWPVEIQKIDTIGYFKYLKEDNCFGKDIIPSKIPIDILITATQKDIEVLNKCIEGVLTYLKHPISNIFVITPENVSISNLKEKYNIIHVIENTLPIIQKEDIDYKVNGIDRSGWLFQQLVKFSADYICKEEHILILDADTVLVSEQKYENNGKLILLISDEFHSTYLDVYTKLTGFYPGSLLSSVCHSQIINKIHLTSLKSHIAKKNNCKWDEAIVKFTDKLNISGFSEYETYGQWVMQNYKQNYIREYYFNIAEKNRFYSRNKIKLSNIRSVSYHSYLNNFTLKNIFKYN
jgi:glycosyltransferase involved in cell wall biosynthesis